MSTASIKRTTGQGVVPYRLTVEQFLEMSDAGVFPDGTRVELLSGLLARKMTKSPPHDFAISRLASLLRPLIAPDWILREEKSVKLSRHWRPEPDLAVVRGPDDLYRTRDPLAGELGMLVEVAESSYVQDRGLKWRKYAASGVSCYWIVNLSSRVVEVYSSPSGRGKSASYRECASFGPDAAAPVVFAGLEVGRIAVRDFLP